ncbi:MAG: DNA-processing protein DprA, partial [Patescibacteria group bacterium]
MTQNENPPDGITELPREKFPPLLKEIPEPPAKLFVRGRLPDFSRNANSNQSKDSCQKPRPNRKYLCVVGSRSASQYGVDACRELIGGLRGSDVVIVSGLAIGIDAIAHKAALDAGLTTIAVLGSGLGWEAIYPRTNIQLAKEILAGGGALISEFPAGYTPRHYNFPERNRIMAGLSHATLVVEASLKSGTLITARLALDYNRDIFTVPGSIYAKQSAGPHMLLSNGAMLVSQSEDILHGLGLDACLTEQDSPEQSGQSGQSGQNSS